VRVLLDENLPIDLAAALTGHEVVTVQQMKWDGIKNGELLRRAASEFQAFVTMDQNLPYQQNLPAVPIAVLLLHAPSNRLAHLRRLVPGILAALTDARPGQLQRVGA
jgi:hypothetical protein